MNFQKYKMEQLIKRIKDNVNLCWQSFSAKVGGGLIVINKEASMQLQFAYLLKNSMDLAIHHNDEYVRIELETGIPINGRLRECDILIEIKKGEKENFLPIELKCYRMKSASGKLRGAQDLFKFGIYQDLELLESYKISRKSILSGIQLSMTDNRNFAYPQSKEYKSWDYDISHGHKIENGVQLNTPIGGKPKSFELTNRYFFDWKQVGFFYFLKLQGFE